MITSECYINLAELNIKYMAAIQLNNISSDLYKYVLKIQSEIKIKKGVGQFSQELTVLQIIREHKETKDKIV